MNNNKLIQQITAALGIGLLAVLTTIAAVTQQQQTIVPVVYATMSSSEEEEEGERGGGFCSRTPASNPDLEGWVIETCDNGEQTWISPSGTRCSANEASNVLGCDEMKVMKGIRGVNREQ